MGPLMTWKVFAQLPLLRANDRCCDVAADVYGRYTREEGLLFKILWISSAESNSLQTNPPS